MGRYLSIYTMCTLINLFRMQDYGLLFLALVELRRRLLDAVGVGLEVHLDHVWFEGFLNGLSPRVLHEIVLLAIHLVTDAVSGFRKSVGGVAGSMLG